MRVHPLWACAGALLLAIQTSCHRDLSVVITPPVRPADAAHDPLFREVAASSGIHFSHFIGSTGQMYYPESFGSGVALLDYDNDGALDIFLVQGNMLDRSKLPKDSKFPPPAGWKPGCRLYRNLLEETGKLQFVDITEQAGIHADLYGMGAAVGDYDNDGYPDIFVTGFGRCVLLHNNGNRTFTDVTKQAGLEDARWSTSASWVDYDRDGRLDLVVVHYVRYSVAEDKPCYTVSGERDYCGPNNYAGVEARLLHNLGNGKFEDVSERSGFSSMRGAGLGVACADLDGDGWPDILIANDGAANHLWLNGRDGTFKEAALTAGVAYNSEGHPQANMGIAVGDFDNDGLEDILITHLDKEGVSLFHNDGRGYFHDAAAERGLLGTTFPRTGFGTDWFDYDNDGFPDLFIANGAVKTLESERGSPYPFCQKNQLFHNEGGVSFREVTSAEVPALDLCEVGRGVAFGDLNNDGRTDIVISNSNGPVRILLNQARSNNHWLDIDLQGITCNRMALGASVEVKQPGGRKFVKRRHTDGSYCSSSSPIVHFGLGSAPEIESIVVEWPGGRREQFSAQVDRRVLLVQGRGKSQAP